MSIQTELAAKILDDALTERERMGSANPMADVLKEWALEKALEQMKSQSVSDTEGGG